MNPSDRAFPPLPSGEGRGEGVPGYQAARSAEHPHPNPLPEGEGIGIAAVVLWGIIIVCCALPILWIMLQIALNPTTLTEARLDSFRLKLLGRTLAYNGAVAVISTIMAIPAAMVLGRARGILASALWFILPISLLLPSLAFAYGWSQFIRLMHVNLEPAGFTDVARCIWSLATWLWPLPAMVMGLALRRSDTHVQDQARLDGVLWRVVARQLLGPAIAGAAMVMILAMQEFAVYEPTGISVVATEMRMVFETGAYSSPSNPIIQPMTGTGIGAAHPDQRARAAAAVATSLPLLGVVAGLVVVAMLGARKLSISEHVETGAWPSALDAPKLAVVASWHLVAVTLLVPMTSMVLALKRPFELGRVWGEFGPQATGSLVVALVTGAVALTIALLGSAARARGATIVSLASFLIGGMLVAIALIRIYNRPWLDWIYNGLPIVVMAYIARFGWIALLAAGATWSGAWRGLRDLAAVDGACQLQVARHVVWPLAWPTLVSSAGFVMILSLSEIPATVLLSPQRPQVLVPMLMTWVHLQRSDVMIEASLLMGIMVAVMAVGAVMLLRFGMTLAPRAKSQDTRDKIQASAKHSGELSSR